MKVVQITEWVLTYLASAQHAPEDEWAALVSGINNELAKHDPVAIVYGCGEVDTVNEGGLVYYKVNDLGIKKSQRCDWWNEIRRAHMTFGPGETNEALYISQEGIKKIWPHVRDKDVRKKLRDVAMQAEPLSDVVLMALKNVGHAGADYRLKLAALWLRAAVA